MKVLTHEEMRAADAASGIPSLVLMENAAYGLLRAIEQRFPALSQERIAIFCGKGNNGGDGLALARLLFVHHRPAQLLVLLAYEPEELAPDAASQLRMLEALGIPYSMQWPQNLSATTLAVDALLGIGVRGEPREPIAAWIRLINELPLAKRVAVDVPSAGLVKADVTVTFAAPKPEHVMPPTCDAMGELVLAPIGIPDQILDLASLNLTTVADLKPVGERRLRGSHKGTFGHVAVLGGAVGKSGALQLSGSAAIQGGAGLVTLYSPDTAFRPLLPDLMSGQWPESIAALAKYRVVAVGPGLGTEEDHRALVTELYLKLPAAVVLDADALNLLAPLRVAQETNFPRVLTPHPGEMKRLLGRELGDRIEDALSLATATRTTVLLKGQRTVIAFATGQVWVNPTGSPALAKAASGDVLTGLIAALLAQYPEHPERAVLAGVYLHGRCGELAHEKTSLASRLCDHLAEAFDELG